eukprot:gene9763-10797_t
MPVHSILILNIAGNTLFSKFYEGRASGGEEVSLFQQKLFRHSNRAWSARAAAFVPQTFRLDEVYVVFQTIGELVVIVCGRDDVDEIVYVHDDDAVGELLEAFRQLLTELCEGRPTEQAFLLPDNYGKWLIAVEEVVSQGILETTDINLAANFVKIRGRS